MLGFERPTIKAVYRPLKHQPVAVIHAPAGFDGGLEPLAKPITDNGNYRQLIVASAFNLLVGHACVRNGLAKPLSLRKCPNKNI